MIIEIGTDSMNTQAFYLPAPPITIQRDEMIMTKRSIQGDLNVTQTGKNKKTYEISWELAEKKGSVDVGVENYEDIAQFCNQASQFYVKIRNTSDTDYLYQGFAYLMLSNEQSKYDSQLYNFNLTVYEI